VKIEDISEENHATILEKYPAAAPALDEALTLEMKEGDSLYVPAFTWIQTEWKEKGIAVSHFGWAKMLTPTQCYAIASIDDILKLIFQSYYQLNYPYREMFVRRWLSLGRHPRASLPGSPVSCFSSFHQQPIEFIHQHGSWKELSSKISSGPCLVLQKMHNPSSDEWLNRQHKDHPALITGKT
jgi:hypothetical protein